MRRLYMAQVVDAYGPNKFLPLSLGYQWCYAKNSNWELVDVLIEKIPPKKYVASMDKPDMLALSCYVWNWEYNKVLAQEVKKQYPECIIVVGGPNVSKNSPTFFDEHPYFDVAVLGEGEEAFKEILNRDNGNYDRIINTKTRTYQPKLIARAQSLDSIPSPILEGFYEPIMAKYPKDTMWQISYETMRGCPYHCAFCDIGDGYWNKAKVFHYERILDEIEWMGKNKIEYVGVCDSNWGIFQRDKDITAQVMRVKMKYGYPKVWDVTWAKSNSERIYEIAKMDKQMDTKLFKGVTFAMQSFNQPTLDAIDRFNIKEDIANAYLSFYKSADIPTYSELIWPMPNETYDTLKTGIQKLIDLGQDDFLMVHPLVLTYNAPMGQKLYREKYNLKTKTVPLDTYYLNVDDLENYIVEKTEAVYETNTAQWEDVLRGHLFSYMLITFFYYGWAHCIMKYLRNKYQIRETQFIEELMQWAEMNPQTLIGKEYEETKKAIIGTFHNGEFWGRRVLGEKDIFWEYKGATSIIFHENKKQLREDLIAFLSKNPIDNPEKVVDFNLSMCVDRDTKYPIIVPFNEDVSYAFGKIKGRKFAAIDHWDKDNFGDDFFHVAYHYQRKNRYWRCRILRIA